MAPLPTIADTFRCALIWNPVGGINVRNVLHVHAPASTSSDVADALNAAWTNGMWKPIAGVMLLPQMEIIKLDGSSSTEVFAVDPLQGGDASGDIIPAAAAVVSLKTPQRGPRGRGRVYMGMMTESSLNDGLVLSSLLSDTLTGWQGFLSSLQGTIAGGGLCVASYVHADQHPVTGLRIDRIAGTVRHRQDQLR